LLESTGGNVLVRKNGKIVGVPQSEFPLLTSFDVKKPFNKLQKTVLAPLGDVCSGYHSTGISNIRGYLCVDTMTHYLLKFQYYCSWIFTLLKPVIAYFVRNYMTGPSAQKRKSTIMRIRGEVIDQHKNSKVSFLTVPDG
jgi:hypothetical protein